MATGGAWVVDRKDTDENGIPKPGAKRQPGFTGGAPPQPPPKTKPKAGGD